MTLFIAFIFVYLPVYISVYRHPFYISMSSKAMLSVIPQAMCSKFPVVLHMDCTFKCNDNEFPILIIGITDACQQFHPLSIRSYLTILKTCMRMCCVILIDLFPMF